ncbi:MAG: DNA-binding MarR family transcriptional regulator [Oceanicoccus sp.]|jgi:DNA-binding MarR family transcriptional regulator
MSIQPCYNLAMRQADRVLTGVYNAYLSDVGLKITQFSVLRSLRYLKACSQKELEKVLLLEQATLTRNLQPLLRDGWVKREPSSQDGRVWLISLTDEGFALYKQAEKRWQVAQKKIESILGQDTLAKLMDASEKIVTLRD